MDIFHSIFATFSMPNSIFLKRLKDSDIKNKFVIILTFTLGIISIIFQCIVTINYIELFPIQIVVLNFIYLLVYFILTWYSLSIISNLFVSAKKLESLEKYNKTLSSLNDKVRCFNHDFGNIVTTIGGYVKTNDMKGLEKYYSQFEQDCVKVNNLKVLNPDTIKDPGIYNLLSTKYYEAEEKGIVVNLSFLLDLNNLNMKIYEFSRILGILLDNAIDAADESNEKILNLAFRNDSRNNRNIILIENTYKDKNVNIDNIFDKGITGKENHTGLGLWEVKQIMMKNNNINLYTYKNELYFSQQLEIYY